MELDGHAATLTRRQGARQLTEWGIEPAQSYIGQTENPFNGGAMRDTENIFDTSTTLMDIDEPAGDDADARPNDRPPPNAGGEPDYFTPNPAMGHTDARRRALAVLGLVGGGIFMAVLISAATGSGESRPAATSKSPTPSERPVGGRSATVVAPKPAPKAAPRRAPATRTRAGGARRKHRHPADAGRAAASAHRHRHHSPAPQRNAPPPEPAYTPEPEPTYVPTEETAPPPATPPPSTPSGGAQQEFGFEP